MANLTRPMTRPMTRGIDCGLTSSCGASAQTFLDISGSSVTENGVGGELVGILSMVGNDYIPAVTYAITSDPSLDFEIVGAGLDELRVKVGVSFDRETQMTYPVTVEATDSTPVTPLVFVRNLSIGITNVNEQPTDIALSGPSSIPENTQPGSIIGVLSTTDVDVGDTFTYTIDLDVDSKFAISGDNLTVRVGASFDFETAITHSVTVRSTDALGLFTTKTFPIAIEDVIEAITDITLAPTAIDEDAIPGATIGAMTSTSTNVGNDFTYSIILDADSKFVVNGSNLNVRVGASFDFEAVGGPSHDVTIRSTSVDNPVVSFDKTLTVAINDINEIPTDIALSSATVADDAADGFVIGTLSGTDPDAGQSATLTFAIAPGGDPSGNFEVVGADFRVKAGNTLDNGVNASHDVTFRTTDTGALTFDETITITVTAASGAVTPLTIVANAHWYQNKTGVRVATGVDKWDDQGPNVKHIEQATGAKQPPYTAASGKIAFDGLDHILFNDTIAMSGTNVHLFMVASIDGAGGGDAWAAYTTFNSASSNDAQKPVLLMRRTTTATTVTYSNAEKARFTNVTTAIHSFHSGVVAGLSKINIDGTDGVNSGTIATPLLGEGLAIGGQQSGTSNSKLDVYEIVYVTESMTPTQIADMKTHMEGVRDSI